MNISKSIVKPQHFYSMVIFRFLDYHPNPLFTNLINHLSVNFYHEQKKSVQKMNISEQINLKLIQN